MTLQAQSSSIEAIPGISLRPNEPLASHTSMGVGGPARWFIEVDERSALAPLLDLLRASRIPWVMLGGGANSIFSDEGFDGAVIHPGKGFRQIEATEHEHVIRAGAAATLSALMNFAKRRNLSGLEFCAGIPGTLGGALAGNAGAGGWDICTLADSVEVLDREGHPHTRKRGEFSFAYRISDLRNDVILAADLHLCPDTREAIVARIQKCLEKRGEQPIGERSSGCMFKNPPGEFAGRLIDRAGLKGHAVGGASISTEHANFMINDGKATATEILQLMDEVRSRVRSATGIELESEVRIFPAHPSA